jgi:hypothetical protein
MATLVFYVIIKIMRYFLIVILFFILHASFSFKLLEEKLNAERKYNVPPVMDFTLFQRHVQGCDVCKAVWEDENLKPCQEGMKLLFESHKKELK